MTIKWQVLPTGRVWVDPGGALGLVPRALWAKHQPPNEDMLVPMDLNSLLVFAEDKVILIDTGLGDKLPPKGVQQWGLEYPEGSLLENLAGHGLSPQDIDIVIDTHLHSDHCGGNTILVEDEVLPAFPNAQYFVQWLEFSDASHPDVRTQATYLPENFMPIWQRDQFTFLYGDEEIVPGVRCVITPGHTRGHQCVLIEGEDGPVLFVADLASYAVQFQRTAWVTAYDVEPLVTIRTKTKWQAWAVDTGATLVFQHDTHVRQAHLILDDEGRYQLEKFEVGSLA